MRTSAVGHPPSISSVPRVDRGSRPPWHFAAGGGLAIPLLCFAVSFLLALSHNLSSQQLHSTFFADSRHYLESCQQVVTLIGALTSGLPAGSDLHIETVSSYLMLDGPILPLMPAIYFALVHKTPTAVSWQPFVILECLIHSLSAVLVCVLAEKLTKSRAWALAGGLTWGLYPAAIVASGRYLTEIPAVLFLLGVVWSASRLLESPEPGALSAGRKGVGLGVWDGIIFLFKPALLPAWLAVNALAFAFLKGWKTRAVVAAAVLVGITIAVLPWALCSKAMTGSVYLTPQRVPVYNVAKGCDTEADGWEALPHPPLTELFAGSPDIPAAIVAAWQSHPAELLNLTLRKVARLWAIPWNDFRVNVFGLSAGIQAWWQIVLLILSLAGGLAVLAGLPFRLLGSGSGRTAGFVGCACLSLILGHLAYAPFEAITRYGFTAMPFVVLLAVYALFVASRLPFEFRPALAMIAGSFLLASMWKFGAIAYFVAAAGNFRAGSFTMLACESVILAFVSLMAFLFLDKAAPRKRFKVIAGAATVFVAGAFLAGLLAFHLDARQERQWSCPLQPGESAIRQLTLSGKQPPTGTNAPFAFVLIDGDSSCRNAVVSVNGHRIPEAPELLLRLIPSRYYLFDLMRTFAAKVGKSVDEIRQWRAVPFPVSWLNKTGSNVIALMNVGGAPVTIYGDFDDHWTVRRHLPLFDDFSAGLFCNQLDGTEGRLTDPVGFPLIASTCCLERNGARNSKDLSATGGRQTGQYRLFLAFDLRTAKTASSSARIDAPVFPGGSGILPASEWAGRPRPQEAFSRKLSGRDFDPMLANTLMSDADLRINKQILKAVSRLDCEVSIPEASLQAPYLRMKVTGSVRAPGAPCVASVLPIIVGSPSAHYSKVLPETPPYLKAGANWSLFQISDVIPVSLLPKGNKYLSVALFPGPWEEGWEYGCGNRRDDACFKDLKVEFEPLYRPVIGDRALLAF